MKVLGESWTLLGESAFFLGHPLLFLLLMFFIMPQKVFCTIINITLFLLITLLRFLYIYCHSCNCFIMLLQVFCTWVNILLSCISLSGHISNYCGYFIVQLSCNFSISCIVFISLISLYKETCFRLFAPDRWILVNLQSWISIFSVWC